MRRDRSHSGAAVMMGIFVVFLVVLVNFNISRGRFHPALIVTSSEKHRFWVEYARTPAQRELGLMNRKSLAENQGMLFLFESPSMLTFWMKNTQIPLDMLFVDENWKIIHIQKMAEPCKSDPCAIYASGRKAKYVLEINGGLSDKLGITEDDMISYKP